MAPASTNTGIPKDSWVLVTGANGYVASHTADQLLQQGYRVRGTVRDPSKSRWIEHLFHEKYGADRFELVRVEDMTAPGAFDQAVKGISGVAHVATILGHTPDLIKGVVSTNRSLLISAAREDTIKRFVYTSSSEAATFSSFSEYQAGPSMSISADTWNEEAVRRSQTNAVSPKRGFDMYAASKTLGEQEIWKWAAENRPGFVINTVLPSVCFGASIDAKSQGHASSSGWPAAIFRNQFDQVWPFLQHIIPTGAYCVDVKDVALLHVAGLTHPEVTNERLFAFGNPFTWHEVVSIFQKAFPDREFPDELPRADKMLHYDIGPDARAQDLLRVMGKPGWSTLEDTLIANVPDM
ncbi:NAD(P)-binding protein [Aspergillus costaricaensis CBS 115574]|uniref:NAD(P)-binding protein n=1 Tax=Aspergillus costaricaensis CBS 115574 TaxID=1448317 RepID=A0ACD1I1L4_9EURO|nr:NAD(P)-binding protein [Aspergillus costaricaensis CBS 115574]RAK84428.1 NAD(P)-binding protein [Aspergillus costaricaensis CBS 115574]